MNRSKTGKKRNAKGRKARVKRLTEETDIELILNLDSCDKISISTSIPFLDHMLTLFAGHGNFGMVLKAKGDIDVDIHHTNEDVAISLGKAFNEAVGDKAGISRYGFFILPMDDALVRVALDFSGRGSLYIEGLPKSNRVVKGYSFNDCRHFFKSFTYYGGINMHITVLAGYDKHHLIESVFKGVARAMRMAVAFDGGKGVPSTKGVLK